MRNKRKRRVKQENVKQNYNSAKILPSFQTNGKQKNVLGIPLELHLHCTVCVHFTMTQKVPLSSRGKTPSQQQNFPSSFVTSWVTLGPGGSRAKSHSFFVCQIGSFRLDVLQGASNFCVLISHQAYSKALEYIRHT